MNNNKKINWLTATFSSLLSLFQEAKNKNKSRERISLEKIVMASQNQWKRGRPTLAKAQCSSSKLESWSYNYRFPGNFPKNCSTGRPLIFELQDFPWALLQKLIPPSSGPLLNLCMVADFLTCFPVHYHVNYIFYIVLRIFYCFFRGKRVRFLKV